MKSVRLLMKKKEPGGAAGGAREEPRLQSVCAFADVSWLSAGSPVSSGISTSTAAQQPDKTFKISSFLSVQTSDWNMDKVYTCKVTQGSQTSEQNIKKSECPAEQ
ncbi:hypothetical protein KUCAC02_037426 [Chaenocephalus aceratus]|nr:hypothetical protein KUCAC02_037426 [Chaenocephalus aceratus]